MERKTDAACAKYMRRLHEVIIECIGQFKEQIVKLDEATKGTLEDLNQPALSGMQLATGENMVDGMIRVSEELKKWLDTIWAKSADDFYREWCQLIDDPAKYVGLMNKLIRDFANFEVMVICLPGTGPAITSKEVQQTLADMFAINLRLIRGMEMIRGIRQAWRANRKSDGFLNPVTDAKRILEGTFFEYLREADPARVAAKQEASRTTGRPYARYRFWRAAECLRQLAGVDYGPGTERQPKITRPYLLTDISDVPLICADVQRIDWAIKEILNNSLAATCTIKMEQSNIIVEPLARHVGSEPPPAVLVKLCVAKNSTGQKILRIGIEDKGHGIPRDHLYGVHLWGYSPRRAEMQQEFKDSHEKKSAKKSAIMIGGKGIGMPFATAIFREHGGDITVEYTSDEGTRFNLDLPIPTGIPL